MIWDFLFYQMPFWLQISLLAIPVAAIFAFAIAIFGWMHVRAFIAPALGILTALGLLSRARQQGYADRKVQEKAAEDRAKKTVEVTREDVSKMGDKELRAEVDKWTRK